MRSVFIAAALICSVVAVVLFVRQHLVAAFVVAVIAVVAGFLSYRVKMKALIAENDVQEFSRGTELDDQTDD